MSLLHCPLCVGLALLSVARAASHLALLGLARPLKGWMPQANGSAVISPN